MVLLSHIKICLLKNLFAYQSSTENSVWSETDERYLIKIFRDYLFHTVDSHERPWLNLTHIISNLTKLINQSSETITLTSRDGTNVFMVSYKELKKALDTSFGSLVMQSKEPPKKKETIPKENGKKKDSLLSQAIVSKNSDKNRQRNRSGNESKGSGESNNLVKFLGQKLKESSANNNKIQLTNNQINLQNIHLTSNQLPPRFIPMANLAQQNNNNNNAMSAAAVASTNPSNVPFQMNSNAISPPTMGYPTAMINGVPTMMVPAPQQQQVGQPMGIFQVPTGNNPYGGAFAYVPMGAYGPSY